MTRTLFHVIVFGPMAVGFIVLLLTAIFARRRLPFILAGLSSMFLSFCTFFILRILVGYGEAWSGYGPQHDFPHRVLASSFFVSAVFVGSGILWRTVLGFQGGPKDRRPPSET